MQIPCDRPVHRSTLRVRYAETDRMGVAYYANYLIWFEVARTDFMREHQMRYRDLEEEGIRLPVSSVEMRMAAPARYDDTVGIDCWIEAGRSRAITFGYRIVRLEGSGEPLIAAGRTTLVCTGPDFRPRSLPVGIRDRFPRLCPGSAAD